ncbi:unnamed protein product [Adineta ricciae]|uniref:G-protein coupled receptors family 1 profile domain-containing protein n=1 Tax=Adineta ricciae TaxID=249248 RepID=A0A815R9W7_ADIRI|nr:unnamed protein product [Adineta ricciae]CAF1474053.1 unnamed protein product [Adineta ricciae]
MNVSTTTIAQDYADYRLIAPLSMGFASVAVIIALIILILIPFNKQLRTVTHLLICNTCISSILYCCSQSNSYVYLLFFPSYTSDISCKWRAYFNYMSIVAVVYSYLLQAISRLFFAVLSTRYRWLTSFKAHFIMLIINWIIVLIIPLPAILTNDIYFRPGYLCWIPIKFMIHIAYSIIAYYLLPVTIIVTIYIRIYRRIKRSAMATTNHTGQRKTSRDLEVLRNIMILFCIYILGAVPSVFYMISSIDILYYIGIVSVSLAVAVEKFCSIVLDREIRKVFKRGLCQSTTSVMPMTINVNTTTRFTA